MGLIDLFESAANKLKVLFSPTVYAVVRAYLFYLDSQASGRWKQIPSHLRTHLQPHYENNLTAVRYAESIDTKHGSAITFSDEIFFPRELDLHSPEHFHWLCHELQHTDQYKRLGGLSGFLAKYSVQIAKSILATRTLDVHDVLDLEKEAEAKANAIAPKIEARRTPPVFDSTFYLGIHSDLQSAFGPKNYPAATDHWFQFGITEGRVSSRAFSVKFYLEHYSDLRTAFGSENYLAAVDHWLNYGMVEGRESSPAFHVTYYLSHYHDLQAAFGQDYAASINHWLANGLREGRRGSPEFDVDFYLSNNADLKAIYQGPDRYIRACDHWFTFGMDEGRQGIP